MLALSHGSATSPAIMVQYELHVSVLSQFVPNLRPFWDKICPDIVHPAGGDFAPNQARPAPASQACSGTTEGFAVWPSGEDRCHTSPGGFSLALAELTPPKSSGPDEAIIDNS